MSEPLSFTGFPDWVQWIILLGTIAVALTGIGVLIRKGWRALTVMVKFGEAIPVFLALPQDMVEIKAALAGQNEKIDQIHHETQNNDGSSIKDSQGRTEKDVKALKLTTARIERGVKGLYTSVADLTAQADQINVVATIDRKRIGNAAAAQAVEIGDAATADRQAKS